MSSSLLQALEAQGIHTTVHIGGDQWMPPVASRYADGLVLEDDGLHLETWLNQLAGRLPASLPIVVYGPGNPHAMATAIHRGAHDYATIAEGALGLGGRLRARHLACSLKHTQLRFGDYVLDRAQQVLRLGGFAENLTTRETALLAVLAARPGWVIALESLSQDLCRRSAEIGHRSIEQHVYRLRKKIDDLHQSAGCDGGLRLASLYGVGYRLDLPDLEVLQRMVA
ncbi:winged helix-turn-helix domain-containing protein [Ideonella sp.]|uniref:winged helix-turn-helix domain-containing protein n=1 Tax=Ideonella sp. TaxID=1929293 RepID=UPI0037BF8B98